MRLIDADKLKAHYAWWGDSLEVAPELVEEKKIFDTIVDLQPTVDARENVMGIWQLFRWGDDRWACTACGRMVHGEYGEMISKKFCDFCGAHMIGVKTSEAQRDEATDAID